MSAAPFEGWAALHAAHERHRARFLDRENRFRERLAAHLDQEIDRFTRRFASDPELSPLLQPIAHHTRDYLMWLRWSAWLSTTLAPPLDLEGDADASRLAIAAFTYLGARLVDDGMDDHRRFKGKTDTLVGRLAADHPDIDPVVLRCQSALVGFSILHHGQQRLGATGLPDAAAAVSRLFGRVIPGIVAEALCDPAALTLAQYRQIIQRKAVSYDMILYRVLLDPLPASQRDPLLGALAAASEVAQYLNDLADREDDALRGQPNIARWYGEGDAAAARLQGECAAHLRPRFAALSDAPLATQDALGSVAYQVFKASRHLWAPLAGEGAP